MLWAKLLSLATPEVANELGIPAEAPVFVSAFTEACQCRLCEPPRAYGPLVYQVGLEVVPHHLHSERWIGGIYVWHPLYPDLELSLDDSAAVWVAEIQGPVAWSSKFLAKTGLRSARVVRIRPYWPTDDPTLWENRQGHLVPGGFALADLPGPPNLPGDCWLAESTWKYRIVGPEVVFTRVDQCL